MGCTSICRTVLMNFFFVSGVNVLVRCDYGASEVQNYKEVVFFFESQHAINNLRGDDYSVWTGRHIPQFHCTNIGISNMFRFQWKCPRFSVRPKSANDGDTIQQVETAILKDWKIFFVDCSLQNATDRF